MLPERALKSGLVQLAVKMSIDHQLELLPKLNRLNLKLVQCILIANRAIRHRRLNYAPITLTGDAWRQAMARKQK